MTENLVRDISTKRPTSGTTGGW